MRDGRDYVPTHRWRAVRPPLRRDRRRRAADRPGAGRPVRLPARASCGCWWARCSRAACTTLVILTRLGAQRAGRSLANIAREQVSPLTGTATAIAIVFVMVVALGGDGAGGRELAQRERVGRVQHRLHHPDRARAWGSGPTSIRPGGDHARDRDRGWHAAAGRGRRPARWVQQSPLRALVPASAHHGIALAHHGLRLHRLGAAGVAAALPARLPVVVHEDRRGARCSRSA